MRRRILRYQPSTRPAPGKSRAWNARSGTRDLPPLIAGPVSGRIEGYALWPRTADMRFEARQQIPDLALDLRHFVSRPQHLLQTAFVQRLDLSEPQARPCFHQSHRLRVGDGAGRIEDEHAVIQFIADLGRLREALDESSQIFRQRLVANPDFGQSLDQIESPPRRGAPPHATPRRT